MLKTTRIQYFYVLITLSLIGCETIATKEQPKEGTITYAISYPEIPEGSYLAEVLPKEMTTKFSPDGFRTDVEASMGIFKTSIISDNKKNKLIHTVKMLNQKYASKLDRIAVSKINPQLVNAKFKETRNSKTIVGYNCKEVLVNVTAEDIDSVLTFKLFYTDDIAIKSPNRLTPFEKIKGVLMEYEAINYNIRMHFTAKRVKLGGLDKEFLKLHSDYKIIKADSLKAKMLSIYEIMR